MKRSQIILIVGTAVCLLFCGAAAWFLYSSLSDADKARAERDTQRSKLENVYKSNPFPNRENTLQVNTDLTLLSNWVAQVHTQLASNTLQVAQTTPSQFYLKLQNTIRELGAFQNASGQPVAQSGFAFGFERYVVLGGGMPIQDNLDRLTRQFAMVDMLVRQIVTADIQSLTEFTREVFEDGANTPPPVVEPERNSRSRGQAAQPRETARPADLSKIAQKEHFTIRFTARQDALETILNRLASNPVFVVVASVKVAKVTLADVLSPPTATELTTLVKPEGTLVKPGERLFPPEVQRIVSGPNIGPLLDITLEVDVFSFISK